MAAALPPGDRSARQGLSTGFSGDLNLHLEVERTGLPDSHGAHMLVLARGRKATVASLARSPEPISLATGKAAPFTTSRAGCRSQTGH